MRTTLICVVALLFAFVAKGQVPIAYSTLLPHQCLPEYPMPYSPEYLYSLPVYQGDDNAGITKYNGNLLLWWVDMDTAQLLFLDSTGYTHEQIVGLSTGDNLNYEGQVFELNDELYFADEDGVYKHGNTDYVPYPDTPAMPFRIWKVESHDSLAWIFCYDTFSSTDMLYRFDGSSFVGYDTTSTFATDNADVFSIGEKLFIEVAAGTGWDNLQLVIFDPDAGAFVSFDQTAHPGWAMYQLEGYFRSYDNKLAALGYTYGYDSLLLQIFDGVAWSSPITVATNTNPSGFYVTNSYDYVVTAVSNGLIVHMLGATPRVYYFKEVNGQYYLVGDCPQFEYQGTYLDEHERYYCLNLGYEPPPCYDSSYYVVFSPMDSVASGSGKVYMDVNQDNVFNAGDYPLQYSSVCNDSTFCYTTDNEGNFKVALAIESAVITPQIGSPYFSAHPESYTLDQPDSIYLNIDFAVQPDTLLPDLSVQFVHSAPARPGHDVAQAIGVENTGTLPMNDTVTYVFDSLFTFNSANPVPIFQSGDTVMWSINNLLPMIATTRYVSLALSTTAVLNSTLNNSVFLRGSSDANTENNTYQFQQAVMSSFDPNDKTSNPVHYTEAGERIQYTVRFQNTGNDTAFNIVIRDTLHENLDWSSFDLLTSSHPVNAETNQSNGSVAFRFNDIMLPDSNVNEPLSHGYVVFAIQAKADLSSGDVMTNTASIYFDFNAPVVTNTTLNVIGEPLGVSTTFPENKLLVFPNPASHEFNAVLPHYCVVSKWVMRDILGRNAATGNCHDESFVDIDVSNLRNGVYTLAVLDAKGLVAAQAMVSVLH